MQFGTYEDSALPSLADLVQKAHPLHEISIRTMRKVTLEDPNFLPTDLLLARKAGLLRGAVIGARYRKSPQDKVANNPNAYVKLICTVPFDATLMHELLEKMAEHLRSEGSKKLIYSNFASWHLLPGVYLRYEDLLDFLLSEGFKKCGECVDYIVDLSAFRVPRRIVAAEDRLVDSGVVFTLVNPTDKEKLRDWVKAKFGSTWAYEAERAIGRPGAGVWVAEDEGGPMAFSVFGSLEHHWFGPIGVMEEKRKMGVGSVMLFKTLESMKQLGIGKAVIPWTGHLFFYSQVPGVVGLRHYWMMSKDL